MFQGGRSGAVPHINEYKCDKCGFALQKGWGYCFYVEDDKGDKIDCHHPGERRYVERVLGENVSLDIFDIEHNLFQRWAGLDVKRK